MSWLKRLVDTPITILDDSGTEVAVRDGGAEIPPDHPVFSASEELRASMEADEVPAAESRGGRTTLRAWFAVGLSGLSVLFGLGLLTSVGGQVGAWLGLPRYVGRALAIPVIVLGAFLVARVQHLSATKRHESGCETAWPRLFHGLCGACGYRLPDPVSGETLSVGPECGSKWKRDAWVHSIAWSAMRESVWTHAKRGRKFRAHDGRGSGVRLLANRELADVVEAMESNISAQRRWLTPLLLGSLALGAACALPLTFNLLLDGEEMLGLIVFMLWLAPALVVVALIRSMASDQEARGVRAFIETSVAVGRCPQCEHALRAEPAHADGVLLCDRCGAGWKPPASET